MANDDDTSPASSGLEPLFPFGSEHTLASIFGPALRSALLGPTLNGQVGDDLFRGPLSFRSQARMAAARPNESAPSDEHRLLPNLTAFPPRRRKRTTLGRRNAWSGGASHPDPEPAEPVLTPLEVVIDSPTFGRIQLGYSPGVDLSQPVALTLDHPRFGVVTLGWILPPGHPDPYAPTTRVRYEETPFQPPAHWKSGPIGQDEAGDGDGADDGSPADAHSSVDAGSDASAKPSAAAFLERLGQSLNPISAAQAAGPEEDGRGFEELLDPLAPVRVARWNYLTGRLREIEPANQFFQSLRAPGHVPTEDDVREAEDALNEALRRRDPSAVPTIVQPPGAEPLFIRPPGGGVYDRIVDFRRVEDLRYFMRLQGASEPEIEATVARFLRERDNQLGRDRSARRTPNFERDVQEAIQESQFTGGHFVRTTGGPDKISNLDPLLAGC